MSSGFLLKGLLFLLLFALLGMVASTNSMFESFNQQWIDLYIRNNEIQGVLYFLLIGAAVTAVGCPRQLVAFLGGYAFGFIEGSLLSTLGVGMSCLFSLYLSRLVFRPLIDRLYPRRVIRIDRFLSVRPLVKTTIIRLLPIGNNLITNLVAGVTSVKAPYFVIGSLVGYYPQMAIFALMGSGVVVLSVWKMALSIMLFFISSALSLWLYREYKAERLQENSLSEETGLKTDTVSR